MTIRSGFLTLKIWTKIQWNHTKVLPTTIKQDVGSQVSIEKKIHEIDSTEKFVKLISRKNSWNLYYFLLISAFKAEFHPRIEQVFFCGSMNRPRQIDCFTTEGDQFNLKGDDLASVCSIVKCHPTQDIVVGGNSSGRVHVFM